MQIRDLLNEIHALDDEIQVGDQFELELDDFVLETVVLDVVGDTIILAIDDVAMPFIPVLSEDTDVWDKPNPVKHHSKLSPGKQTAAKRKAKAAGRAYPNMVDNIWAAKKKSVAEGWSEKYKRSIDCSHPKGFSQKAHCAGKKKHNESAEMEMVCPDCGMCETHGNRMMEIKQRLDAKCWTGKHKEGTKIKGGVKVNNCVPNKALDESVVSELAGYGSDLAYANAEQYKRYDIFVGKKKYQGLYFIAVAENPRTRQSAFKAKGATQDEAIVNVKKLIDQQIDTATKVSGRATLDFNVDFVREILEMSTDRFYAKIIPGPRLVIAGKEMLEHPDIMRDEGFQPSTIRTYNGGEGTTRLPGVPLSSKSAMTANLIANGRYALGNEAIDRDGNRVFELNFDSVVQAPNEKIRMGAPALTVGTSRHQDVEEAKYHGRTVPLSKPMHGDVKKSKVYVKNPTTGKVVKVNFGDKNMRIKKSLPGHRKSFRARHHCATPGPRTKARYWSCRAWE